MADEKLVCKICKKEAKKEFSYTIQTGKYKDEKVYLCSQEHLDMIEHQDSRILGKISTNMTLREYQRNKKIVALEEKEAKEKAEEKKKAEKKNEKSPKNKVGAKVVEKEDKETTE